MEGGFVDFAFSFFRDSLCASEEGTSFTFFLVTSNPINTFLLSRRLWWSRTIFYSSSFPLHAVIDLLSILLFDDI